MDTCNGLGGAQMARLSNRVSQCASAHLADGVGLGLEGERRADRCAVWGSGAE